MKITIIGCGNAGSTVGADLALKGHEVTLLKTSKALHNEHFKTIMERQAIQIVEDGVEKQAKVTVTQDMPLAIKGRDLVIIYIQTNYHEQMIKRVSDYLEDGQAVLIEPGYLSTCYLMKYCKKDITVIEAESSPIDCRIIEPGKVKVLFRNVRNPVGVFPKQNRAQAKTILDAMDLHFELLDSVVEAALHNPNLIVHTIGAIFSTPRIEYQMKHGGSYSMYKEVFTPHIWNLVEALDDEKMNVLEQIGVRRLSYVEACKYRNSLDDGRDALEVFFDYANNSSPDGPNVPDSRYATEDVPQGLVLLESLGKELGVETPVCTGLINCASAILKRDFRLEGRTVERLGKDNIQSIINDN